MATLLPLNTPSRQPFGVLNDSKIRSLQSVKNRQNAITPNSAPNLKRRAPSPELSDSENVDPNILDSFGKRKRAAHDEDVSLCKPSRYSLHVIPATKPQVTTPVVTPRLDPIQKPSSTPLSAPPAAGRSPTRGKRMGLMQPRKRFAPPSFGTKSSSLSITAALNGTLAHKKAKKLRTIEDSKPKSWFFDIFEESEEQQNYRMNEWTMTQSATGLDISDDEGKMQEQADRGKENVDPNDVFNVSRSTTTSREAAASRTLRKDAMLDEPRTPLGDLNPSEFYGEGLDATSVVLVHEDPEPQPVPQSEQVTPSEEKAEPQSNLEFTFESSEKLPAENATEDDIHAILAASAPTWEAIESLQTSMTESTDDNLLQADSGPIEIWESESAKDEEEAVDSKLDDGAFALQEL